MLERLTSEKSFEQGLGSVLVANVVDATATALYVGAGVVTEGNPMMAMALDHGVGWFVLGKVALVGLGAAVLYRNRHLPVARLAVLPAVALYAFVIGNHLGIAMDMAGLFEPAVTLGARLLS